MYTIRKATEADAISLAKRLRPADLRELNALGYDNPEDSLLHGVREGDVCFVGVDEEDIPHFIFGTVPTNLPFMGCVWMMGSNQMQKYWVKIVRDTKPWIEKLRGHYKVLANAVHVENEVHVRWLRWAGFTFLREITINGNSFYEFAKLTPTEVSNV